MPDDQAPRPIDDEDDLRAIVGEPPPAVLEKEMPALDAHCRHFIELSPILFIGSTSASGRGDVSPRGDPAGFVKVIDDRTVLIPERPGNRMADTLTHILENPRVALIFLVPGVDETLRLRGKAAVIDDAEPLAPLAVNGKPPRLGIRVEIEQVFFHCGRALKRASLWDPETVAGRKGFPSYGKVVHDQRKLEESVAEMDAFFEDYYGDDKLY